MLKLKLINEREVRGNIEFSGTIVFANPCVVHGRVFADEDLIIPFGLVASSIIAMGSIKRETQGVQPIKGKGGDIISSGSIEARRGSIDNGKGSMAAEHHISVKGDIKGNGIGVHHYIWSEEGSILAKGNLMASSQGIRAAKNIVTGEGGIQCFGEGGKVIAGENITCGGMCGTLPVDMGLFRM